MKALVVFLVAAVFMSLNNLAAENRPSVGAIRWDAWFGVPKYENFLGPKEWHSRLPFYARILSETSVQVLSNTQEILDQEIQYAAGAGLDYWAFCYYHPKAWPNADFFNYAIKLYLSSKLKNQLKFCFVLQGMHLGLKEEWDATITEFVNYFKEETYVKVLDNRPLVYIFHIDKLEQKFGSWDSAKIALDQLRKKCTEAGLGSPYIVAQIFVGSESQEYLETLGVDALSGYTGIAGSGDHEELPYKQLMEDNRNFWNGCKDAGKKVIPIVNTGWDGRPRLPDEKEAKNYRGSWYAMPAPLEFAANLKNAMDWVRKNKSATEANSILIYAWNETDEGGWLVPTLSEGTARLDAIAKLLRKK